MQKEQSAVDSHKNSINLINRLYDDQAKAQTTANRVGHPIESGHEIALNNAQLVNQLMKADVNHRLSEESAKMQLEPYFVQLTDDPAMVEKRRAGAQSHIAAEYAGQYPVTAQYAPAAIPKYNPPPQVQKFNGVPYQKVQGGWKKVQ